MDRRSWPWRKKSSEKILGLTDSVESSPTHFTRQLDEQEVSKDYSGLLSDEGTAQWQPSEEKFQQLKERLSVALLDASAKDELIKQHAKVAEEAVSGWEKAEAEALTLKQQLESVMQQKLATEDRVSHLDGALKECMRQLRHVREEQEEKIHDATIKNTREWERVCAELEEKLVDMEQKYLDRDAENKVISKLLQERAVTISEISEARSHVEADLNVLQIRLESMEREQNALKFECNFSKQELETKNEEKLWSKRSTDAANRQHLENSRKITKLEGECQRLRGLVRKKLPGPGTLMQMKSEVESSKIKNDSNRKKIGKGTANLRVKGEDMGLNKLQEETPNGGKDVDALLDRLSAMEDETRRLKDLLARRDVELQHARLMCARTASKLSSVEEQLERLSHDQGLQKRAGMSALDKHVEAARSFTVSCEPSLASVSEDGNDDCSDAWASALIAELAHFKIEKATSFQESGLDMSKVQPDNSMEIDPSISLENVEAAKSLEQNFSQKAAELHAAHQLCDQVSDKLRVAEEELATLQTQNAATQLSLQTVQCQLDAIFQAQDDGKDMDIVLDQVREASGIPHHRKGLEWKNSSGCSVVDVKLSTAGTDLTSAVSMIVSFVEDLGFIVPEVPVLPSRKAQQDSNHLSQPKLECSAPGLFWKNKDFDAKLKAFSAASDLFLQGTADIAQFLGDLASILGDLVITRISGVNAPPSTTIMSSYGDRMSLALIDAKKSGDYSPVSDIIKSDEFEKQATKAVPYDENSITTVLQEYPSHEVTRLEEELRKVQGEKVALETHLRMEFQRFEGLDKEVVQLRGDKVELEHLIEVVKEELGRLKTKLHRAEQVESNLWEEVSSAKSSRQLMEEQLLSLNATKTEAETQLKVIEAERKRLQDRVEVLERGCLDKKEMIAGLESKCLEFTEQLSMKTVFVCSNCSSVSNDGEKKSKEQEIATKLAECQQTILLLGKQLKTFTSSKGHFHQSHDHSIDQLVSAEGDDLSRSYVFSHSPSELHPDSVHQTISLHEVRSDTSAYKRNRRRGNAKNEMDWEPHRDSSASEILDSELMSLSKSGRPLLELFGDKTPAHEHYIQAVEQLTSSSDEECEVPRRVEPVMTVKSAMKPPLHQKKKSLRLYTGVHMSKSMDDTSSEKHNNTFTRLFSRAKNT
eukprot:c24368_g2_i1 orf=247-3720(+)